MSVKHIFWVLQAPAPGIGSRSVLEREMAPLFGTLRVFFFVRLHWNLMTANQVWRTIQFKVLFARRIWVGKIADFQC